MSIRGAACAIWRCRPTYSAPGATATSASMPRSSSVARLPLLARSHRRADRSASCPTFPATAEIPQARPCPAALIEAERAPLLDLGSHRSGHTWDLDTHGIWTHMGSGHTWDLDTHGNTLAHMRDDTGGACRGWSERPSCSRRAGAVTTGEPSERPRAASERWIVGLHAPTAQV